MSWEQVPIAVRVYLAAIWLCGLGAVLLGDVTFGANLGSMFAGSVLTLILLGKPK